MWRSSVGINQNKLVLFVQKELNRLYGLNLPEDGVIGRDTIDALYHCGAIDSDWPVKRRFVGFVQYLTHIRTEVDAVLVDGFWGHLTEYAFQEMQRFAEQGEVNFWYDDENDVAQPQHNWPKYYQLEDFYGKVGTNIAMVKTPYPLKVAWDTSRILNQFSCNEKVVEPIQEAMETILDIYGRDEISRLNIDHWGGCFNIRKMRGSRNRMSVHAYGAAIDWMPTQNGLRWDSTQAVLAKPEYEPFWDAWTRTGATSLGLAQDRDWMHVQYCDL